MDEEQYHIDAFETYYKLRQEGKSKTDAVEGVHLEHQRSKSAIWEWKKDFDWDEKTAIRAAKINKNIQDKTDATIEENKVQYLGIVHTSLNKYVADVKNGAREPLEINSSSDLERLIKLGLVLQDEPTEHTKTETSEKNQFDKSKQKQILEEEGYDEG